MEQTMNKRTLDALGGVGSILCGIVCLWFAQQHSEQESIWKVWMGFFVLLVLNGIAMIIHSRRSDASHKLNRPHF